MALRCFVKKCEAFFTPGSTRRTLGASSLPGAGVKNMVGKLSLVTRVMGAMALACLLYVLSQAGVTRLNAQGATATLQGNVTDTSGAAVPEAAIQVRNVNTAVTQIS